MVSLNIARKFQIELHKLLAQSKDIFTANDVGINGKVLQRMFNEGLITRRGRKSSHVTWGFDRIHINKMIDKLTDQYDYNRGSQGHS